MEQLWIEILLFFILDLDHNEYSEAIVFIEIYQDVYFKMVEFNFDIIQEKISK